VARVVTNGLRQDYRWLTPTGARLAHLTLEIPRGYHRGKLLSVSRTG
jgi:hypothetical protein